MSVRTARFPAHISQVLINVHFNIWGLSRTGMHIFTQFLHRITFPFGAWFIPRNENASFGPGENQLLQRDFGSFFKGNVFDVFRQSLHRRNHVIPLALEPLPRPLWSDRQLTSKPSLGSWLVHGAPWEIASLPLQFRHCQSLWTLHKRGRLVCW